LMSSSYMQIYNGMISLHFLAEDIP
jgi:hypothetical protein